MDPRAALTALSPAATRWTLTVDLEVSIRISDHVGAGLTVSIPVAGALPAVPAIGFAVSGQFERNPP
jgi:hypothetical protein